MVADIDRAGIMFDARIAGADSRYETIGRNRNQ